MESMKINIIKQPVAQRQESIITSASLSENISTGPYLILGHDDYIEHKSAIVHCKYSIDGKLIASVDINGVVKSKSNLI